MSNKIDNLARKINKRMVKIAAELGKDSKLYERYTAALSTGFDVTNPNETSFNKNGVLQIKRKKENLAKNIETLQLMEQLPTYQETYKKAEKELKEEKEENVKIAKEQVIKLIKTQDSVKGYISDNIKEMYVENEYNGAPINRYAQEAIAILKNKRNTWEELEKAVDLMRKAERRGIEEYNYFTELEEM